MIVAVCVDDSGGMLFNGRRQSRDRKVRDYLLEISRDAGLWMNGYSAAQFADAPEGRISVSENFLEEAPEGSLAFAENQALKPFLHRIEKIILLKWNRQYPADLYLDIPLEKGWKSTKIREFPGYSHEKITVEVYEPC